MEGLTFNGLVVYTFLLGAITLAILYMFKHLQMARLINKIPGPKTVPLFGNALDVNVEPRALFPLVMSFCDLNSNGTMIRLWLGSKPYVLIFKSNGAEVILSSNKYIDKSHDYDFLFPWLGTGLLTSTGSKWHKRRKILTPAFHFKILDDFIEIFNQQSFRLVQNLKTKANGQIFDIFQFITLCTLDIILESAMGRSINAQDNSESDYVKAVYKISAIIQYRQTRPWLHSDILFKLSSSSREHEKCLKILHGFTVETIKEKMEELLCNKSQEKDSCNKAPENEIDTLGIKKKRLAFLDLLLEYSKDNFLSVEDIREEVDTFMFEGHDTTAAAINWAIYLLGWHPEIQKEVHAELDSIFGDSDRTVTSNDLREMKFLECCIKESLRLFPSVPIFGRDLKEDVIIDGYKVPAGTTAIILTFRLHRDPEQFPEPESFKPERFMTENSSNRHPYAYVPFSAGPRNCIGQRFALMEEKVVLANLFRKYRVESTVEKDDLNILGELILRPEDGNLVKLFPR